MVVHDWVWGCDQGRERERARTLRGFREFRRPQYSGHKIESRLGSVSNVDKWTIFGANWIDFNTKMSKEIIILRNRRYAHRFVVSSYNKASFFNLRSRLGTEQFTLALIVPPCTVSMAAMPPVQYTQALTRHGGCLPEPDICACS